MGEVEAGLGDLRGTADGPLAGLRPGSRIAGYRLDRQVGAGGMAVVFRAHDERLNRQVALKLLAPKLADDEEFRQRFLRESQAAAAVDHPHIIPVFLRPMRPMGPMGPMGCCSSRCGTYLAGTSGR